MKQINTTPVLETLESRTMMSTTPVAHLNEIHNTVPGVVAPAMPTGLAGTVHGTQVQLTWTDNSTNELGFVVFRADGTGGAMKVIGAVAANTTTFTDTTATNATDVYVVRAYNSVHNSEASNRVVVQVPDLVQVIAPRTLTAKAISTTAIQITWDRDYGATAGYRIERSLDGHTWATAGTTAVGVRMFNDTSLTAGTKYYYRVVAMTTSGRTATSTVLIGMTKLRDAIEHHETVTHH